MKELKQFNGWIVTQAGHPIFPYFGRTRHSAISKAMGMNAATWAELRKQGYRAVRVEVTPC